MNFGNVLFSVEQIFVFLALLRYSTKQAVELQESVADLETAVQLTSAQFVLAQQELGPPLINLETALSSNLSKIIPEIQDILQNIVKITDQIESVSRILQK